MSWLDTGEQQRAFILTDICNEPDDEQSLIRLLLYSNEIEIDGLVATTSCYLREHPREDVIRDTLKAYGQVRDNLLTHAPGYPEQQVLEALTASGQSSYGMGCVGTGKSSVGSRLLLAAADTNDKRPLWVLCWGGSNTLAQALDDARREKSPQELAELVAKIRVYSISDQDDAGPWIRREFPGLFYIVNPSNPDSHSYSSATWSGISGDQWYKNGPGHVFDMVQNPWLDKNIRVEHGALCAKYPKIAYIMEGDTPTFFGLIQNGLGWPIRPDYGGWGGRYKLYQPYGETRKIWTSNLDISRDTVTANDGHDYTSDQATIWRWRKYYQNDFAARANWCISDYSQGTHAPIAVLNGDETKRVLGVETVSGEEVKLSTKGSRSVDKNRNVDVSWWVYPEAGSYHGTIDLRSTNEEASFTAPTVKHDSEIHIILEIQDKSASPILTSFRRIVVHVLPSR